MSSWRSGSSMTSVVVTTEGARVITLFPAEDLLIANAY